jgi:hypothetical protein
MVERVNGTIKNATVKAMTYQNIDEQGAIDVASISVWHTGIDTIG